MTEKKSHPMDNPALGQLVETLTAAMLERLDGGQLENWQDAVFAAGLAANAVTTVAYTRCEGDATLYKGHAAKVLASALKQIVEPVMASGQDKSVTLRRVTKPH